MHAAIALIAFILPKVHPFVLFAHQQYHQDLRSVLRPLFAMPPNQGLNFDALRRLTSEDEKIAVAILGCGMMGQEHISYISGYRDLRIDFLCDPFEASLDTALTVMSTFNSNASSSRLPLLLRDESDLLSYANEIDLLVIASPNYLHTESLRKWGKYDITILVEKPVAVSQEQHDLLKKLSSDPDFVARIWVAMEYRYIPAIAKLLSLIPAIGVKMCTIRENRYPFLHKIGAWNRNATKTGDTLVEKCVHFFDLFRLITGKEIAEEGVRSIAQRGVNYLDEDPTHSNVPIMDAAFVIFPFEEECTMDEPIQNQSQKAVMGCLELCMYAEGSRHQEEIIVTGTKGRLEAYLPENKVFFYKRPDSDMWKDRSVPPPQESIHETIYDCTDVKSVHDIKGEMPTHGGYHYSSTAVEWYKLIDAMKKWQETGSWDPEVSLDDGLRAVRIGLCATNSIVKTECLH